MASYFVLFSPNRIFDSSASLNHPRTFLVLREKTIFLRRAPFVNLIRPLCLVYCTGVWLQYAFGVGLVDWPKSGRWCPRWYGHTLYTFPILAVTIESFIARHQSNGFLQAWCRSSMAIGCFVGLVKERVLLLNHRIFLSKPGNDKLRLQI